MKVLGTQQFLEKKYKLLDLKNQRWKEHLGDLPVSFMGIIYGNSGNGKTEYCVQLAKVFTEIDKVAWLSYEQGHGYDLKLAIQRNHMHQCKNPVSWIDPLEKKKPGVTIFEALDAYLSKRSTPHFVFIDSLDYTRLTTEQYFAIKEKYGKKKGIIFISHASGRAPKTSVGVDIQYDGGFGVLIKNFIAHVNKNRFGGNEPFIVWEKMAREREPLFFDRKALENKPVKVQKRKSKKAH